MPLHTYKKHIKKLLRKGDPSSAQINEKFLRVGDLKDKNLVVSVVQRELLRAIVVVMRASNV